MKLTVGLVLGVVALAWMGSAMAQEASGPTLEIDAIDSSAFPQVAAYVTVTDEAGFPVIGLGAADFTVREDGNAVDAAAVSVRREVNTGNRIVLGVDTSMSEDEFAFVRDAVRRFVEALDENDELALMTFADEATVVADLTGDQAALLTAVDNLALGGDSTNLYGATVVAVDALQAVDAPRRSVILITNTGHNVNTIAPDEAINSAVDAGVAVYPIAFVQLVNPQPLVDLAVQSNGQEALLSSPDGLRTELQTLSLIFRQGYLVEYTSAQAADGATRTLSIETNVRGQVVSADADVAIAASGVTVAAPALADTVSGVVTLTAQATGPNAIDAVTYTLDGAPLATVFNPPYAYEWDSSTVNAGDYVLTVRAVDVNGNASEVTVAVAVAAVTAPTVRLVAGNATVRQGETVTVEAQVSNATAVQQVEFLVDGVVVGVDDTAPYTIAFDTRNYAAGEYEVRAIVRDVNGAEGEEALAVAVQAGLVLPSYLRNPWWVVAALVLGAGLTVLLAVLVMAFTFVSQRRSVRRIFALELANDGNYEQEYGLRITETELPLAFKFQRNGRKLPTHTVTKTIAPAPTMALATASAQPAMSSAPAARSQPVASQPAPASKSGPSAGKQAMSAASGAATTMQRIASILPPSIGQRLAGGSAQIRQAQYQVRDVTDKPRELQSVAESVAPGQGGRKPPERPGGTGVGSRTAQAPTQPVPDRRGTAVAARQPQPTVMSEYWAKTTIVPPGESVTIDLVVDPKRPNRADTYSFEVVSQVINAEDAPAVKRRTEVEIIPVFWLRRMLPWLTVLAAALVMVILGRFAWLMIGAYFF